MNFLFFFRYTYSVLRISKLLRLTLYSVARCSVDPSTEPINGSLVADKLSTEPALPGLSPGGTEWV